MTKDKYAYLDREVEIAVEEYGKDFDDLPEAIQNKISEQVVIEEEQEEEGL